MDIERFDIRNGCLDAGRDVPRLVESDTMTQPVPSVTHFARQSLSRSTNTVVSEAISRWRCAGPFRRIRP